MATTRVVVRNIQPIVPGLPVMSELKAGHEAVILPGEEMEFDVDDNDGLKLKTELTEEGKAWEKEVKKGDEEAMKGKEEEAKEKEEKAKAKAAEVKGEKKEPPAATKAEAPKAGSPAGR